MGLKTITALALASLLYASGQSNVQEITPSTFQENILQTDAVIKMPDNDTLKRMIENFLERCD